MQDILSPLIEVAKQAGQILLDYAEQGFTPEYKKDGSVVTAADRASEDFIRQALAKIRPDVPFLGEESVEAGRIPDISGGTFWCVDPLDGTRNFVERNGKYAILIGLIENGLPVLGVLYAPIMQWTLAGAVGTGAQSMHKGNIQKLQSLPDSGVTRILAEHKPYNKDIVKNFVKKMPNSKLVDSKTVWPLGELALGDADVTLAFSQSFEWDTAATHAILRSLGGDVFISGKQPLAYGKSPQKFLNPHVVGCHAGLIRHLPDF